MKKDLGTACEGRIEKIHVNQDQILCEIYIS